MIEHKTNEDSPEIITYDMKEFEACANDPMYFITYYCKIINPIDGIIPFHMYDYQRKLVREYEDPYPTIIAHAQKMGITQLAQAYLLWYTLFKSKYTVMVTTPTNDDASIFIAGVREIYDNLPDTFLHRLPKLTTDNKKCMAFDNGSRLRANPPSDTYVRGACFP